MSPSSAGNGLGLFFQQGKTRLAAWFTRVCTAASRARRRRRALTDLTIVQPDVSPPWRIAGGGSRAGDGATVQIDAQEAGLQVRQAGQCLLLRWDTLAQPSYGPKMILCPYHRGRKAIEMAKIVPLAGLSEPTARALLTRIEGFLSDARIAEAAGAPARAPAISQLQ